MEFRNIKSYEDACKVLGIEPKVPDFSMMPEKHRKVLEAHAKLVVIAEAVNEGWTPDWEDSDQVKCYPWFLMDKSAGGFSYDDYDLCYLYSYAGSRLCFRSRELAEYMGEQFESLYKDYFVIE